MSYDVIGEPVEPPLRPGDEHRREIHRQIEALPTNTLFKVGRRFPSGVQGSHYKRTAQGADYAGPPRDPHYGMSGINVGPDDEMEVVSVPVDPAAERRTYFLCIGHPAWPDPFSVPTEDRAREWLGDDEGEHPDIYVVRVEEIRTRLDAGA